LHPPDALVAAFVKEHFAVLASAWRLQLDARPPMGEFEPLPLRTPSETGRLIREILHGDAVVCLTATAEDAFEPLLAPYSSERPSLAGDALDDPLWRPLLPALAKVLQGAAAALLIAHDGDTLLLAQ
jgi:hypothetical protein